MSTEITRLSVTRQRSGARTAALVAVALLATITVVLPPVAVPATGATGSPSATSFSDVPTTSPFYDAITWAAGEGIAQGFPDGTFRPGLPITRGAMAAFVFRFNANGAPAPTCSTSPFADVSPSHPFCREIAWLKYVGLTAGYPDGTYRPDTTIRRDEGAAMLHRVLPLEGSRATCLRDAFPDVPAGHPFCGAIAVMHGISVVQGRADGTFAPGAPVSRQAMAAYLHRVAHVADDPIFRGGWDPGDDPALPPDGREQMSFHDVSCVSADHCVAVGRADSNPTPPYDLPLLAVWDGETWTEATPPPLHGSDGLWLRAVSCWAVDQCAIVGEESIDDDSFNVAMLWDGIAVHDELTLDPWSLLEARGDHQTMADRPALAALDADVDCVTGGACMVVDDAGVYAWWSGDEWTMQEAPVHPPLSCASATQCVANGSSDGQVWDGTGWTPGPPLGPSGYQAFTVDCADADWCLSGGAISPPLLGVPAASRGDGSAWQQVAVPLLREGAFIDLACQPDRRCLALAYEVGGIVGTRALAWNGQRWYPVTGPGSVPFPATASTTPFRHHAAIDCVDQHCMAVGWREEGAGFLPISSVYAWSDAVD